MQYSKLKYFLLTLMLVAKIAKPVFAQSIGVSDTVYKRYNKSKKVIEVDWKVKKAPFVRDSMFVIAPRPFDGLVFKAAWPESSPNNHHSIFYPNALTLSQMELPVLQAINWSSNYTDNFIYQKAVGAMPLFTVDSTWNNIINNMQLLSQQVTAANAKGIWFDAESYLTDIWVYNTTYYPNKTLDQMKSVARIRGNQFVQALQSNCPDIKILFAGHYSFITLNAIDTTGPAYITGKYTLLKPFVEGMINAAGANVKIIEGNENSYFYTGNQTWHATNGTAYRRCSLPYNGTNNNMIAGGTVPFTYAKMPIGQALYYNYLFNANDTATSMSRIGHHLYNGLFNADEYCWFYTELGNNWWSQPIFPKLDSTIRSVKSKIAQRIPLHFSVVNSTIYNSGLSITYPAQNQIFQVGDTITFQIASTIPITNAVYYNNYRVRSTVTSTPFSYKLRVLDTGWHHVYVTSNSYQQMSQKVYYRVVNSISLPIENIEISAKQEGCHYTLSWAAKDDDFSEYDLEYSTDGVQFFTKKTFSNHSTNKQAYNGSFDNDKSLSYYFRLKAIGINGRTSYSKVVRINKDDCLKTKEHALRIAPNPVKELLKFSTSIDLINGVSAKLINNEGKVALSVKYTEVLAQKFYSLTTKNLPPGTYILILTSKGPNGATVTLRAPVVITQ